MNNKDYALDLYTPIDEAKEEIWRRWNDTSLKNEVADYLGELPEVFRNKPRAVWDRNVITPNYEFMEFVRLANQSKLKPLGWEYLHDKFCTINKDKHGLAKMSFIDGRNKRGEIILHSKNIIDFKNCEGRKISEIDTLWGESLPDFHHNLLASFNPSAIEIYDASLWYKSNGEIAAGYYPSLLSLFICNGILFENFIANEKEAVFCEQVVLPSFTKITQHFGIKPLIVPLIPISEQRDRYWTSYPESIEGLVLERIKNSTCSNCKDT